MFSCAGDAWAQANSPKNDTTRLEPKVRVIFIKRCARAVTGGHRFSFSALVVVGDGCGRVGLGLGKSGEVATAIAKAEKAVQPKW